jgi:hypothetical protein
MRRRRPPMSVLGQTFRSVRMSAYPGKQTRRAGLDRFRAVRELVGPQLSLRPRVRNAQQAFPSSEPFKMERGEDKMSNSYVAVSALIFALVAVGHVVRLVNRWTVAIGRYSVSMNVSWAALVVSALLAIWGFMQIPH